MNRLVAQVPDIIIDLSLRQRCEIAHYKSRQVIDVMGGDIEKRPKKPVRRDAPHCTDAETAIYAC